MLTMHGDKHLMNKKPIYVLDATPIIYFAKIGKLELYSISATHILPERSTPKLLRGEGDVPTRS